MHDFFKFLRGMIAAIGSANLPAVQPEQSSTQDITTVSDAKLADRLPEDLPSDPMHWADAWLKEATAAKVQRNPNSMTIASVGADSQPSSRVMLCKDFVPDPGYLVFYTNYRSKKSLELAANPNAAALFHWDALGRQIRIEGTVVRSPAEESDAYFATRDRGSQLGAWGSDQSETIASHDVLVSQIRQRATDLGLTLDADMQTLADDGSLHIARPEHWGGFRLWATMIELWIEGKNRVHDRASWRRDIVRATEHTFSTSPWTGTRLQP
jgi:pyridoxamine 5'-phosphate oxidase